MSQVVTKQSLAALAALAFQCIAYEDPDPGEPETAAEALYHVITEERGFDFDVDKDAQRFIEVSQGAEFGLAVAASILTHNFDHAALAEDVKNLLRDPKRYWPESSKEAA